MSFEALPPARLLEAQRWRYATKKFDPARPIPPELWAALEETLVLTPSSYGLQPWKFLVITDPALKTRLRSASWNQAQVEDCSHHVVFLAREALSETDLDRFLARTAELRGQSLESLAGYKGYMMGDLVTGGRSAEIREWAVRQVYIALGNFMTSAALLGVDTCPMEGLNPVKYDEILGLKGSGYRTVVACPAGFRAAGDKYAAAPKVRFPLEEIIERR
ncbi:MAG: NAD(P)H-dependent oxidoreductase [Acidobacteria bacterium]|nr:NAD(P)H-dependent oxidoreductase [Acidobacteriota bacterium]